MVTSLSLALAMGNSLVVVGIWAVILVVMGAFFFTASTAISNDMSDWLIGPITAALASTKLTAILAVVGVIITLVGYAYGWQMLITVGIRMLIFAGAHGLGRLIWRIQINW